jgi:hypothetical protein
VQQNITVNDNTKPTFNIVGCTSNLGWNPTAAQIEAGYGSVASLLDNCGGTPTLVNGYPSYSTILTNGCLRTRTKTWKYEDACGNFEQKSCTVNWYETPANNCWSVSMLSATPSGTGNNLQTTYTFNICSKGCGAGLSYVAFVTTTKITMVSPLNGSTYVSSPYTYKVLSPISKTQNGVKFEIAAGEGIKNSGDCNLITFTVKGALPPTFTVEVKAGMQTVVPITVSSNCVMPQQTAIVSPAVVQPQAMEPTVSKLTVSAYPNPVTTGVVKFTILSPVTGKANLEVVNMLGQKIQNVFNGSVEAGVKKSVDFNVPKAFTGNFMYILRVGDKTATGKLLQ